MTEQAITGEFLYEVASTWTGGSEALLPGIDANGVITLAEYPGFENEGMGWSAEHLFLSAACTGFMTTLLAHAKKYHLQLLAFTCRAKAAVTILDGQYQFKSIDLYPCLTIADELLQHRAKIVLQKTQDNCLILNSISSPHYLHQKIIVSSLAELG